MNTHARSTISRRSLLKASAGVALFSGLGLPRIARAAKAGELATLIDLSLCDGCAQLDQPACVQACRERSVPRVPEPVDPIPPLKPRGKIEDWSKRQAVRDRLTPYTWLFVQEVHLTHAGQTRTIHIPRRCMHCDNPACATICPFTANHKHRNGAVVIDPGLCFGGAKCRTVCPWGIPQRQSGVGIYLDIMPTLAGNGVMFKCDLCHDRLMEGQTPLCMEACPRQAMLIGKRDTIYAEAQSRAQRMDGYLYGAKENGGTSTLYVSPVPFDALDAALETGAGRPHLEDVRRRMQATDGLARGVLGAPVIGLVAGLFLSLAGRGAASREEDENHG